MYVRYIYWSLDRSIPGRPPTTCHIYDGHRGSAPCWQTNDVYPKSFKQQPVLFEKCLIYIFLMNKIVIIGCTLM